jgi:ABC-2 type transport system permease protein
MQVFKLCLQVFKKNIPVMMIYFGVFLAVSVLVASATRTNVEQGFRQSKSAIAIISEDQSPLIEGLKESLSNVTTLVDLPDENSAIQDALFFRKVEYVLRIPAGFTESFMKGEEVYLEKTTIPNSVDAIYMNLHIDQYLRIAKIYLLEGDVELLTLKKNILKDMALTAEVELAESDDAGNKQPTSIFFYNYMGYGIFSVLILGISTILLVFNKTDIRRRNSCSPIKVSSMNIQLLVANVVFSLISWAIFVGVCMILNPAFIFTVSNGLLLLNSLVFTLCATSISFFIGMLVKHREAISAISNVVALGSSFISGVFVPQELLSSFVLKLASFTPTYWYIRGNNLIGQASRLNEGHLRSLFGYMGVVLGFTIAFVALALVVGKQKQLSEHI